MSEIRTKRISRESGMKKQEEQLLPPPTETAVTALAVGVQAPSASEAELPAAGAVVTAPAVAVPVVSLPQPTKKCDGLDAMLAAQKIVAQGCEEVLDAWAGAVKTGLAASRDAGIALLDARSLFDAIAANVEFSNRAAGVWADGSRRLSEIGCKTAASASRELTRAA